MVFNTLDQMVTECLSTTYVLTKLIIQPLQSGKNLGKPTKTQKVWKQVISISWLILYLQHAALHFGLVLLDCIKWWWHSLRLAQVISGAPSCETCPYIRLCVFACKCLCNQKQWLSPGLVFFSSSSITQLISHSPMCQNKTCPHFFTHLCEVYSNKTQFAGR